MDVEQVDEDAKVVVLNHPLRGRASVECPDDIRTSFGCTKERTHRTKPIGTGIRTGARVYKIPPDGIDVTETVKVCDGNRSQGSAVRTEFLSARQSERYAVDTGGNLNDLTNSRQRATRDIDVPDRSLGQEDLDGQLLCDRGAIEEDDLGRCSDCDERGTSGNECKASIHG